jgi:DNA-binding Lrp family transcriptional regulator
VPTAFVLVNTNIGSEIDVLREIRKLETVQEATAVYGVYDIIAIVASDSMEELKQTITWDIRKLDNVRATLTMIVHEDKAENKPAVAPAKPKVTPEIMIPA